MVLLFIESTTGDFTVTLESPISHPRWLTLHSASVPLSRTLDDGKIGTDEEILLNIPVGEYTLESVKKHQDYRLKKVADIQTAIETELAHYERVYKRYKRAHSDLLRCSLFCGGCTVVLPGGSLASALSGFGIVVGAPMAGVAALLGIVSGGCAAVDRGFESKIDKHTRTAELAKSKLSTIVDLVSKAINDGRVSQEEFSLIVAELDKFRQQKAAIRAKFGAATQGAQPKLGETPAEIETRIRGEILKRSPFSKWSYDSGSQSPTNRPREDGPGYPTDSRDLMEIGCQRPPLHNGHLYTTATSTQRPPLHNGHLYTTATSTQRPPLHNAHFRTTTTSTQRPPLHNDHPSTSAQRPLLHNDHPSTSAQRPFLHNDHLYTITATSTHGPGLYNGHLSPPLHNGHLCTTPTSAQRPPLHNDHPSTSAQRPLLHNDLFYTTTISTQRPPEPTSAHRPPV
ncbi:hypothetical protein QZH41_001392 [Actinostola sp. cb2023]|nr:hypothetical protein QZH41_001392 [Actinostola sp. cb2023]